ncbi:hypothetical protein [Actinoplanes couchii]|uniref:YtxH domain-containing protein n=1 Tax=Actinoplanes couchii TaxID=403638 RepID=A0ABQ3XTD4_9ACTN|nr:hypothetical protein [Actinoplanes couchii]MDR6324558.1 hypothetical protein [Actinoplanes couchii]GID61695.1 hypothetical protein Aco03nite_100990 [Actinoplanes couchii]
MKILRLATGFAVGYVLGSRAGRDKYEQIVAKAREAQNHPAMTQAKQKVNQVIGATTSTVTPRTDPILTQAPAVGLTSTLPDVSPTTSSPSTANPGTRRGPSSSRPSPTGTDDPLT